MSQQANDVEDRTKSPIKSGAKRRSKLGQGLQKIFAENSDRVQTSVHLFDQPFDECLESWQQLLHFLATNRDLESPPASAVLLREHLLAELSRLESAARGAKLTQQQAQQIRYLMAVIVDEAINSSRWAVAINWHFQSLAITEFNDSQGGVQFFNIIDRALQQVAANALLLKLCYMALLSGFEGRYAREPEPVKQEALALYRQRLRDGLALNDLKESAVHCVGGPRFKEPETGVSSLWRKRLFGISCIVLLLSFYLYTTFSANRHSDRLLSDFESLSLQIAQIPKPISRLTDPDSVKRLEERLNEVLQQDIAQSRVLLSSNDQSVSATLQGRTLFKSGTDQLDPQYQSLLDAIGRELQLEQGDVVITGHTDNVPIFTPKYPSNWHLSKARAESIERAMQRWWHPLLSVEVQGAGDTRPLVANSSPENRARNRRVEIVITPALTSN